MELTQEDISELKKMHFEKTGEKLSDREAWDIGTNLMELAIILHSPYGKGEQKSEKVSKGNKSSKT